MAKKENAGSKKAQAAKKGKGKRNAAKAQKNRAAKDAAAVKAVLDAEAVREADETQAAAEELVRLEDGDEMSPTDGKRRAGRKKGDATPQAEIERQEKIKEALDYRKLGYTYREIAEEMGCAPSTAHKWVEEGLQAIPRESAEAVLGMMVQQCEAIMPKLMNALDDTAPKDIIDNILKVQSHMLKLHGLLRGGSETGGGLSVTVRAGEDGETEEEIIIRRIRADAPVLRPDEPVPASPVL